MHLTSARSISLENTFNKDLAYIYHSSEVELFTYFFDKDKYYVRTGRIWVYMPSYIIFNWQKTYTDSVHNYIDLYAFIICIEEKLSIYLCKNK